MKKILFYIIIMFSLVSTVFAACNLDGNCDPGEDILFCPDDCNAASSFCGDGFCNINEQSSCPADCGSSCTPTNKGVEICDNSDNDCDGQVDESLNIACNNNADCGSDGWVGSTSCNGDNVWQDYRTYSCSNDGTCFSDCDYDDDFQLKTTCPDTCLAGSCTTITCNNNADCGTDSWVNSPTCNVDDVWQDYRTYICNNPGTPSSSCSSNITSQLNETCVDTCFNGSCSTIACNSNADCGADSWIGSPSCNVDDVWQNYTSFTCNNPGTPSASCSSNNNYQLNETCPDTCFNASCVSMTCNSNLDCNDNNSMTIDFCNNPGVSSFCSYSNVTVYGQVIDTDNGSPLEGINVSFYDSSIFNPFDGNGNYSALIPKLIPDVITDSNGYYYASLVQDIYHMVLQGSDEKDFNIYVNDSDVKVHDAKLDENRAKKNFNTEGHIIYSGKYEHGNKYVCGELVTFTMFGVNNGATDETITFLVQDHTSNGGPTAPIIYYADINNSDESLTIPAGQKIWKNFTFFIPCSYDLGKYDVHVVWDNESYHHIGNFFIIADSVAPKVNIFGGSTFTNQALGIDYLNQDTISPDTVRANELSVQISHPAGYAFIDQDISKDSVDDGNASTTWDNDGVLDNDIDAIVYDNFGMENLTWSESGHFTIKIWKEDATGNYAENFTNVTVYITEAEADVLGQNIYNLYGLNFLFGFDQSVNTVATTTPWNLNVDRWFGGSQYGDEYLTSADTFTQQQIDELNQVIYQGNNGPEFIKPIPLSTATEYNDTLKAFFYTLKCVRGESIPAINCNNENFAPVIWKVNPTNNVTISSSSSQAFSASVVDPNNDAVTCKWYDNSSLLQTGSCNYLYVADVSKIGVHEIKVTAEDSSSAMSEHIWQLTVN